ncbi:lipopolysaccharide biosynthesis protein [Novosphingobium beihaiensis]|uniref:Membrane protein involved in the export of O-antigen and teichoic acid n=1 Tax=Novosphingobium beihaiensis TaxID=2930389 RepID=A0ABT0BUN9_9SPHN|nr:hypothetical protein [Novosphingobium beihaiensis]MCJ2188722.1 hypothetical protein [Novosphingobium beihaiensis]
MKRVIRGMSGQAFSRGAIFINTLGVVPMLLAAWGLTVYGEWITLTAIATLTSLSNFGLANAASTEILKATGASDNDRAQTVFGTAFIALACIFGPVLLVIFGLVLVLPVAEMLKITHVSNTGIIIITMAMASQVWLNTVKGLFFGASFSSGTYAAPNLVSGLVKLLELASLGVAVGYFHGGPAYAAVVIACVAGLDLIAQAALAVRAAPWLKLRNVGIDRTCLKMLMGPSMGAALLHLGVNFVGVQGPRIILSSVAGPEAVGVFSVYATATRIIDQISSLAMSVFQIEFSRTSGGGQTDVTMKLLSVGGRINVASCLILSCGLLVGGPIAFDMWTHGRVSFEYPLACAFLLATLFVQTAKAPLTYLQGANYLFKPVVTMLIAGAIGLAIGSPLAHAWGPLGMAMGKILAEGLALIVVTVFAAHSIGTNSRTLLLTQFNLLGFMRQAYGLWRTSLRRSPA